MSDDMAADETAENGNTENGNIGGDALFPCTPHVPPVPKGSKLVNLALQGGGSHGAFTWGVLDEILADGRLAFEGISGTSAGSINGAVLCAGLRQGGPEKAREMLHTLWQRVARSALFSPFQPNPLERLMGNPNLETSPFYQSYDFLSRLLSPYQLNPLGLNPLRTILADLVDFAVLQDNAAPRLFVSATDVLNNDLHIFSGKSLSVEAIMASSCLPQIFQAVEIAGKSYWDGGYLGNPALYPLIKSCGARDIIIVQISPLHRHHTPTTPASIIDRLNEITMNAALTTEIRGLQLVNRLIRENHLTEELCGMKQMHIHAIAAEDAMSGFSASSKFNADWGFLTSLKELGQATARDWLAQHFEHIGKTCTFAPSVKANGQP